MAGVLRMGAMPEEMVAASGQCGDANRPRVLAQLRLIQCWEVKPILGG